jgi:LmbE family N-acetylglucosaminyl deacetylase
METYHITATHGEYGWMGNEKDDPGREEFGRLCTAELEAATRVSGVRELIFLA